MPIRIVKYLIPAAIFALILSWAGCSNSVVKNVDLAANSQSPVLQYFPLSQGYTTVYATSALGITSQHIFTAGDSVRIGNASAMRWIVRSQSGALDTSYFVLSDSALYYLESQYADPEKILSLPFTVGNSWQRYYNYDVTGYSNGNLGTNINYGWSTWPTGDSVLNKDTTGSTGAAKNYPSEGANTFTIAAIEPVTVGSLGTFSGALKVTNIGYNGTTNFYWFAPGIGLVKYLIGVKADGTGTPQAEGELIARS